MTREQLIQAIYFDLDDAYCPEYNCTKPVKEDDLECCRKCAERQLAEYEKQLKTDTIKDFLRYLKDDIFSLLIQDTTKGLSNILDMLARDFVKEKVNGHS